MSSFFAKRRWLLVSVALLGIVGVFALVHSSLNRAVSGALHVAWPMSRGATARVSLTVPSSLVVMGGGLEVTRVEPRPGNTRPGLQASLSFNVLWPEMAGRTRQNSAEFNVTGGGRLMMISLESGAIDDFQGAKFDAMKLHQNVALNFLEDVCVPTGRPMPDNVSCARRAPSISRHEFGLQILGRDYVTYPILPTNVETVKDVLQDQVSDGESSTLIQCNPDGLAYPAPFYPRCQEVFLVPELNALVQVDYPKSDLSEWKSIREKTSSLLLSFIDKTNNFRDQK